MQLLINISNEDYEKIKKEHTSIWGSLLLMEGTHYIMVDAIANGTLIQEDKCKVEIKDNERSHEDYEIK